MIIGILLFTLGFFVAWFAKPNGATWRTVLPPEDKDRGPNADDSYRAVGSMGSTTGSPGSNARTTTRGR